VVFSDGVIEAVNVDGTEFGEDRLAACVDAHADLPVEALVSRILETVQAFSAGTRQADDLTALALACTPSRKAV
jgi:sigma-B regulation protein RsbU (phosphoserine phosphatase)